MERNRVLWVIFSISLFLVVVLAGGLYLLRPVGKQEAEAVGGEEPATGSFDAFEYVRGRSELPELAEESRKPDEMVIIVGEQEEKETREEIAGQEAAGEVPERPQPVRAPLSVPEKAVSPLPERPAPAAATGTAPASPKTTAPRPAPKPASKPAAREVQITEYWIQAGSYTSPSRAQEVTRVLEEQGLACKITTRALSGKTYYRVRIGPYQSKAEAEKFLEWVKAVKGFESSYVSMVYAQRRVN